MEPPEQSNAEADLVRVLAVYAGDLEGIVRRYVNEAADRDDLRQEIAIALWRALPRFHGASSERTYVARIAKNRAITFCLRLARNRALQRPLDDELVAPAHPTGEHDIERLRRILAAALRRLPVAQRQVMLLAAAGRTPGEIAMCVARSPGATRVMLHRARHALRRLLTGQGGNR